MICPECGKMLPDDAGFCIRCGENQHNPNAEVYKKTKASEEKNEQNNKEKTRVLNIIPDEASVSRKPEKKSENNQVNEKLSADNAALEENPAPKRRKRKPAEKPEEKPADNEINPENDDTAEEVVSTSPKFAVISVVLALIICLGIIIYFFTQNSIGNNAAQQQITETTITEETTSETTEITTVEETTETEPPVETSVVTDAENNSYTIELTDDIPAKVVLEAGMLRIRAYPSTDSAILGQLANGQEVTVNGVCGEWFCISYDDKTGFVFSEYIQTEQADVTETAAEDNSASEAEFNQETTEDIQTIAE